MVNEGQTFQFNIPAGNYDSPELDFGNRFALRALAVHVKQGRNVLDDIGALIADRENFIVWRTWKHTSRASSSPVSMPQLQLIASGKLHWSTLVFEPPALGQCYLVLDNTHSTVTSKNVTVNSYEIPIESQSRKAIREALAKLRWDTMWRLFE